MNRASLLPCACVITAALVAGCNQAVSRDDDDEIERAVTMEQLPPAVRESLMRESGTGKVADIDQITENGKTFYEADLVLDGKKWEVVILADGKLSRRALDTETDDDDDDDQSEKDDD